MKDDQRQGIVHPPPSQRPRPLREVPDAPSMDEAVKNAEERMEEVIQDQADWADDDLARLIVACERAEKDPENCGPHLDEVSARAHELKGMGGNFGYQIVTKIASLLCEYVQKRDDLDMRVVALYVDSLRLVFDRDMKGDGGEEGRLLINRLSRIRTRESDSNDG